MHQKHQMHQNHRSNIIIQGRLKKNKNELQKAQKTQNRKSVARRSSMSSLFGQELHSCPSKEG